MPNHNGAEQLLYLLTSKASSTCIKMPYETGLKSNITDYSLNLKL